MLRDLLVKRSGLVTHTEPRRTKAYELLVGAGPLQTQRVDALDELKEQRPAAAAGKPVPGFAETVDGPVLGSPIPLGVRTVTGSTRYDRVLTERRTSVIDAARITMAELAGILQATVDAPVVDKTGLTDGYRLKIELPQPASSARMLLGLGITTTVRGTPLTEPVDVSVFKAVEGLGLKLETRHDPVDVVIIDQMARTPTPN